jgi:outer membrane protein OmpA-like peptidoglycan-associated protein
MGNALFDLNLDSFFGLPVAPYVGVGAGYVWQEIKNARFARGGTSFRIDDQDDGNFAYQAIAGVAFKLFDVPGLAFTAEYRFLGTLNTKLGIDRTAGPPRADVAAGFRPENYNHSALLGVRYNFGAARPAPAAAETPPPVRQPEIARTYLVFFDWNRADLTDRARQIIGEAANNSRNARSTRVEVAGHADRSGTPQYNQRLSQRRADVVAAELVRQGVNRATSASRRSARAVRSCRPRTACASRRTAASKSCCARSRGGQAARPLGGFRRTPEPDRAGRGFCRPSCTACPRGAMRLARLLAKSACSGRDGLVRTTNTRQRRRVAQRRLSWPTLSGGDALITDTFEMVSLESVFWGQQPSVSDQRHRTATPLGPLSHERMLPSGDSVPGQSLRRNGMERLE